MKKLHVHMFVRDVKQSTEYYRRLFSHEPSLLKDDYARWELANPAMNFAISNKGKPGIDHLGIQLDSEQELERFIDQLTQENLSLASAQQTSCCYARSSKSWSEDPQGISWELFHTSQNEPEFSGALAEPDCCTETTCCS